MLLFLLRDGTKIGITDHDQDLTFTLPEDGDEIEYNSKSGFKISDVETRLNLEPGSYEVSGPVGDVATRPQLMGGRWRRAETYLFDVNWKAPTAALDLMKGNITAVNVDGGEFRFEIRDEREKLNQTIGSVITNQCRRRKASCCVNIAPETDTTVASVTDPLTIVVDAAITPEDFVGGKLWFTDGDLAGNDPVEIFAATGSTLTLYEPLPSLPAPGDAVTLKEGCDGTIQMCSSRFDNALNFDGFPAVRGNKILQPAIPGQGNG
jgi:uncharacterized phage protein (TIGR02218 family)